MISIKSLRRTHIISRWETEMKNINKNQKKPTEAKSTIKTLMSTMLIAGNFKMISRLNEVDLCVCVFLLNDDLTKTFVPLKSTQVQTI